MTVPALVGGVLPLGRWACTPSEVEHAFVQGSGGDRIDIWNEWRQVTEALRQAVGAVAAVWMSGSFISDKRNPADIDCLYVVDTARLDTARPDPRARALIDVIGTSRVKSQYGLRVDSYILEWTPYSGSTPPVGADNYLKFRGYWDDFWVRSRDTDPRLGSIPRRGYLEVILDGYH